MEVIQFIMQYEAKVKGKNLSIEEDIALISSMIKTKKYINISKKKKIIQDIIKNTIMQDDNLNITYDGCDKYLYTMIKLISEYTDLNMNEQGYDLLCSHGLLSKVMNTFAIEYDIVIGIMDIYMDELTLKQLNIRGW